MQARQKERDTTAGTLGGNPKSPKKPKNRLWEPKITEGTQNPIVGTQKLILVKKDAREGKVGIWELETPMSKNITENHACVLERLRPQNTSLLQKNTTHTESVPLQET